MDIEKSALHNFYLRSCKVLLLHKGNACDVFSIIIFTLFYIYIIVLYNRNPYLGPDMTREKKKKKKKKKYRAHDQSICQQSLVTETVTHCFGL